MSAGGRTHDADSIWIELPFSRSCSHETHGTGSVLQHRRMVVGWAESILENESSNAMVIQPLGVDLAFVIGQMLIAATRTDNHRRAHGFGWIGEEGCQRWNVLRILAQRTGSAFGPERK